MPTTPPVRRAVGLTRRTAVGSAAAIGAAVVTGCTPSGVDRRPRPTPARSAAADPDVALAAAALAVEQRMLDLVTATQKRHPALATVLSGALAAHRAHVDLLSDAVPDRPSASASPSTSPSPSGSVSPSVSPSVAPPPQRVPARPAAALSALSRAEDRVGLAGRRHAFAAQSGAFARVLASIAAAAAQQSVVLASAARERR